MPLIDNRAEAIRLRDRIVTEHGTLKEWRQIRDREMDGTLDTVKGILPLRVQSVFIPVQSQEPDDEVQARKHVLASNEAEIEVVSRVKKSKVVEMAASYEDGLDALHEELFSITVQLDECDGFLADGETILALDYLGPGEELGKYADRANLEQLAEAYAATRSATGSTLAKRGQDATSTPASEPAAGVVADDETDEPVADFDDEDDSPEAVYARAYLDLGDHEKAYDQVTRDAMVRDGLRYRVRVLDTATWDMFPDLDGVNIGMEDGEIEIHPALRTLADYGVVQVGNQLMLSDGGAATDEPALAPSAAGKLNASGTVDLENANKVRYTQIRTREQIIILVDRPAGAEGEGGEGLFITYDTPLDDHTGYVVIEGDTKLRAANKRCQPVILGLLETHQRLNTLKSVGLAMSLDEGTRDIYQPQTTPGVAPIDPTQEVKAQQVENGSPAPQVPELKRVETTGIDIEKQIELTNREADRFRMHEFFAGSGGAGEPALHLARMQTAYAMRLQPYQTKRAKAHKEILSIIAKAAVKNQESVFVPFLPKESRGIDEGIRVAEPREITPEMCALPVDVRVTIGAESPETKYAAMQMSQTQTTFGTWSMTQHRINAGVKDPHAMEAQILEDNIVADAIGGEGRPGWMVPFVRQAAEEELLALIKSILPAPPAPTTQQGPADMQDDGAAPNPGDPNASVNPTGNGPAVIAAPTQTVAGTGGLPAVSGLGGAAQ